MVVVDSFRDLSHTSMNFRTHEMHFTSPAVGCLIQQITIAFLSSMHTAKGNAIDNKLKSILSLTE